MYMVGNAVFWITLISVGCALVLAVASKLMALKSDERIGSIISLLPGINCGVCGFPGCEGYATALVETQGTRGNLCIPGGPGVMKEISRILGIEEEQVIPHIALIHCSGGQILGQSKGQNQKEMQYRGLKSCLAAQGLYGGNNPCTYGCLGYGDCLQVCPVNAICLEKDLARINPKLCTGCGLCKQACPTGLITLETTETRIYIGCKNLERGADGRKKCSHCCLGCSRCVRECPEKAISVVDNLARIDYSLCTHCGQCKEVCPAQCIQVSF